MTRPRAAVRHRGDSGAATLWMVLGTIIIFAVAGLVFDGGTLIAAKRDAINDAEEAARAGAQAIDTASVLAGGEPQPQRHGRSSSWPPMDGPAAPPPTPPRSP